MPTRLNSHSQSRPFSVDTRQRPVSVRHAGGHDEGRSAGQGGMGLVARASGFGSRTIAREPRSPFNSAGGGEVKLSTVLYTRHSERGRATGIR